MDGQARERYCLFDTAIGRCGVAWSERGLTRLQLPASGKGAAERRLKARAARNDDPPAAIEQVIAEIRRYLAGEAVDFSAVIVDLPQADAFQRKVYEAARSLGWGETATYGELALKIGEPGAAREVGQALARNPVPVVVPCHRILASGDRIGGFSAPGGTLTKKWLLALEGAGAPLLPGMLPAPFKSESVP
jgi:methylated-DNA-[protein]-cysteine S-methyltransferase